MIGTCGQYLHGNRIQEGIPSVHSYTYLARRYSLVWSKNQAVSHFWTGILRQQKMVANNCQLTLRDIESILNSNTKKREYHNCNISTTVSTV